MELLKYIGVAIAVSLVASTILLLAVFLLCNMNPESFKNGINQWIGGSIGLLVGSLIVAIVGYIKNEL